MNPIEAVIVNHNTSGLAEIALRSLRWTVNEAGATDAVNITIVDNHSTDQTSDLRAAAKSFDAEWELSRWPAGQQPLTSHGDVLRDFVLARPDAAGYLFVESDMCFHEGDALAVMLGELKTEQDLWALQARMLTAGLSQDAPFAEVVRRKRRPIHLSAQLWLETDNGDISTLETTHQGRRIARCHPGCTLIRNSDAFQLAATHFGLSSAWTWSNDTQLGGLSDTLGLVSLAMRTHRRRYRISAANVIHFWHGTQLGFGEHHRRLLERLRCGDWTVFAEEASAYL